MSCMCSYRCDPHCGPCGPKSRGLNWDQWPHIVLPELPQAGEGECLENCGEYSTVPHSDSSQCNKQNKLNNRITYLCVLVWQWASLQRERAIFVNVTKFGKGTRTTGFYIFLSDTVLKSLNLPYLNKSERVQKNGNASDLSSYFGLRLNERQAFLSTSPYFHCEKPHTFSIAVVSKAICFS